MDKKEDPTSIFDMKKKWAEGVGWISKRFDLTPVEAGICAMGVVVVLLGTLLFLALNLDAMLLALFLGLSFGFAVLSFTSGIALLQEETIEVTYPISVPFDLQTNNLPGVTPAMTLPNTVQMDTAIQEVPNDRVLSYFVEIARLAHASPPPTTLKQKKAKKRGFPVRLKKEVILTYGGEIIQYQIFKLLQKLQRGLWLSHHGRKRNEGDPPHETPEDTQAEMGAKVQNEERRRLVGQVPRLSKMYQFQGEPLWNIVSVNQFSVVNSERDFWRMAHLYLPENTRLSLNCVVASPHPDHLGYNVQLVKPWFFDIRFTLVPITPVEWNIPPVTHEISSEEAIVIVKYNIRVKAHFQRLTAGNRQTEDLKAWARWLLDRIKPLLKTRDLGLLWEELKARADQNAIRAEIGIEVGKERAVLKGHTNGVTSVSFSPDGRQIASGSQDNTVCLWEAETGKLLHLFKGHELAITSVSFSPDGRQIASGSQDRIVRRWDAEMGKELAVLKGHTNDVTSIAFSPDGRQIVSGSGDNVVRLWEAETGKLLRRFKGHALAITAVSFSPDGRQIASGSRDSTVHLWDIETGKKLTVLSGHKNGVTSVAFNPDGLRIASGGGDNIVRLWDTETGKEMTALSGHKNSVTSVAFSPNGRQIASGSRDNTVRLWEAETGKSLRCFKGHERAITSVSFSPDGLWIASGSQDSTLRLWDAESGQPSNAVADERDEGSSSDTAESPARRSLDEPASVAQMSSS